MGNSDLQKVYIIGSKGIPAKYGGFETFVEKLTEYHANKNVKYYVACMAENSKKSNLYGEQFIYNNATCLNIHVPQIGPARAIYYDMVSLNKCIDLAKRNGDRTPIFYILACRIGPFINIYKKQIDKIGGKLFVNPDGHEWLREKWSKPVRLYWKLSEKLMVKHADLLVCDSKNIESYIINNYRRFKPKTTFIAYGTDMNKSTYNFQNKKVVNWFNQKNVTLNEYYLVVGRFVPENNYEKMIKAFMKSNTTKDLVLITNVENNKFYKKLEKDTGFSKDKRIKFVGTVYNQKLLKYIRENAYAYVHGHMVGGTNPSLLEGMYSSKLNLLYNVGFNKEVGGEAAIYWEGYNLDKIIGNVEELDKKEIEEFDRKSKQVIEQNYSWETICKGYYKLWGEKL